MSTRTVRTQGELDAALADPAVSSVIIDSPRGVWLQVRGSATVEASGSATVRASGSATVRASGSATVRASGSATVEASGSATVRASGSATVEAWDSATVEASGSATVEASGSATVRAWGSATVEAWDSATVRASSHVAVHLHSGRATVAGGVLIDHTTIDLTDPQTWCDYHGVPVVDGIATLHKAVGDDWSTDRGTDYSPGSLPEAPDWRDDHECGGGLHFSPHPRQSRSYYLKATRYLAVGVALADLRPIAGGTPKAKAPRVVIACREVDIDGKEVQR